MPKLTNKVTKAERRLAGTCIKCGRNRPGFSTSLVHNRLIHTDDINCKILPKIRCDAPYCYYYGEGLRGLK